MGSCCSSSDRKSPEEAARQLDSLFVLSNKDFFRVGTQDDLLKHYQVLEQENQSHANCTACLLTEKATGETKFCKVVTKSEEMQLSKINETVRYMGRVSHPIIVKVQEVYYSNDKIYLVSSSLRASHKSLAEANAVFEEG